MMPLHYDEVRFKAVKYASFNGFTHRSRCFYYYGSACELLRSVQSFTFKNEEAVSAVRLTADTEYCGFREGLYKRRFRSARM